MANRTRPDLAVADKTVRAEWRRLNRRTEKLLDGFEGWRPDWLTYEPSSAGWSVLQVLDHLVRTEALLREEGEKTFKRTVSRPSLRERWKMFIFSLILRLPARLRVPRPLSSLQPGSPLSIDEVVESWRAERRRLAAYLQDPAHTDCKRTAFWHPAIGSVSTRSALRLLRIHMLHHTYQLNRLRRAVTHAFL